MSETLERDPPSSILSGDRPTKRPSTSVHNKTTVRVYVDPGREIGDPHEVDLVATTVSCAVGHETDSLESLNEALNREGARERFEAAANYSLRELENGRETERAKLLYGYPMRIAERLRAVAASEGARVRVAYRSARSGVERYAYESHMTIADKAVTESDWRHSQTQQSHFLFNYWDPPPEGGLTRRQRERRTSSRCNAMPAKATSLAAIDRAALARQPAHVQSDKVDSGTHGQLQRTCPFPDSHDASKTDMGGVRLSRSAEGDDEPCSAQDRGGEGLKGLPEHSIAKTAVPWGQEEGRSSLDPLAAGGTDVWCHDWGPDNSNQDWENTETILAQLLEDLSDEG